MSICSATGVTMLFVMFDRPGIASRSDVFCWSSGWRKSRAATFFLTTLLRRRDAAASSSSSSCDAERGHGEDGNDDGVADDAADARARTSFRRRTTRPSSSFKRGRGSRGATDARRATPRFETADARGATRARGAADDARRADIARASSQRARTSARGVVTSTGM
eukprot:31519-Pelagococcus_subviridis.AAC.2